MTLAMVIVLPEPVTPRRVWNRSPRSSPAVSSLMARGWSPAGRKGAWRSKLAPGILEYTVSGFVRVGAKNKLQRRVNSLFVGRLTEVPGPDLEPRGASRNEDQEPR